ncbi:hypothetical protein TrRE_jg3839 [Triparma retinervis]|uniref:Flavodoxin-like domain-containing protein n=1 Tax=Triparma retinervis TaxID=2557542 RepID=A0A9W7EC13_9STRA|nr:hypothetical protein TrRE_jg3839 [Triparma retinervis]
MRKDMQLTVFWGGEVADAISDQIKQEAPSGFEVDVVAMESYGKSDLEAFKDSQMTAVFLLQTVENNQPPEEASKFLRFFKRKTHPETMLADKLKFAVLGLGDSNLLLDRQTTGAKDCNACGQLLDTRLEALGATRIYELGLTDERTGMEEVEPWIVGLWETLGKIE